MNDKKLRFGNARLHGIFKQHHVSPDNVLMETIDKTLNAWKGSKALEDDISLLLIRRLQPGS